MFAVIVKFIISFIASVLFAILCILGVILFIYWTLLLASVITGLIGMFNISVYLRAMADGLSERIKNVFKIIKGDKNAKNV